MLKKYLITSWILFMIATIFIKMANNGSIELEKWQRVFLLIIGGNMIIAIIIIFCAMFNKSLRNKIMN